MIVREVVHAHVPVLSADSPVRDAVAKMDIYQFSGLAILDADEKLIGVITEGDLGRAVYQNDSFLEVADHPAMIYGSNHPQTVGPDVEIGEALHKMLASGITILPVIEGDHFFGVVYRADLMHALLIDSDKVAND